MISRLTTVATTLAVLVAVLLATMTHSRAPATIATADVARHVRFIELEPVVVTTKRLQHSDPI